MLFVSRSHARLPRPGMLGSRPVHDAIMVANKECINAAEQVKDAHRITALNEVGRYAIGVRWADGHDSIYPLESLRRGCPCKACGGAIAGEIPAASQRLSQLSRLGEQGVFLGWIDGHETLYTTGQLRASCRCAHCVAEPEKPITG